MTARPILAVTLLLISVCSTASANFPVMSPAREIPSPAGNNSAVPHLSTDAAGDLRNFGDSSLNL